MAAPPAVVVAMVGAGLLSCVALPGRYLHQGGPRSERIQPGRQAACARVGHVTLDQWMAALAACHSGDGGEAGDRGECFLLQLGEEYCRAQCTLLTLGRAMKPSRPSR